MFLKRDARHDGAERFFFWLLQVIQTGHGQNVGQANGGIFERIKGHQGMNDVLPQAHGFLPSSDFQFTAGTQNRLPVNPEAFFFSVDDFDPGLVRSGTCLLKIAHQVQVCGQGRVEVNLQARQVGFPGLETGFCLKNQFGI